MRSAVLEYDGHLDFYRGALFCNNGACARVRACAHVRAPVHTPATRARVLHTPVTRVRMCATPAWNLPTPSTRIIG